MLAALAVLLLLQAPGPGPGPGGAAAQPGVITGQLKTNNGTPANGIRVSVMAAPRPGIKPSDGQNYFATVVATNTTVTDAQGRYRLRNLAPGRYLILASVLGYPTYYPSTEDADLAEVVEVPADKPVIEGVNFTVLLPPGGRLSGQVQPAAGPPGERAVLAGLYLGEILEAPVEKDGTYQFGHVPEGLYNLSLFPTPPGMPSKIFEVGTTDMKIDLVRPTLYAVTGRISVTQGPLPFTLLEFTTDTSYVAATINADGTFRANLQPARHRISVAGVPVNYSLASARLGTQDVSKGLDVGKADVSGLTVVMNTPPRLPTLRGQVVGVPAGKLAGAKVQISGRLNAPYETDIRPDGTFEFPAVTPGTYLARVPQLSDIASRVVVLPREGVAELQLGPPGAR